MPSLEDDSINGSRVDITASDTTDYMDQRKPKALRDRILDYALNTTRPTRNSIAVYVSGSGSAGTIISGFIREGVFIEKLMECGNCIYFEVDKTKVHLE